MRTVKLNLVRCICSVVRGDGRDMYYVVGDNPHFLECSCPRDPIGGFETVPFELATGAKLEPGEKMEIVLAMPAAFAGVAPEGFHQRLNDLCGRHGAPTGVEKLAWLDERLTELELYDARLGSPAESSSGEQGSEC